MANQTAVRFGYPDTLIREYEHWLVLLREPQATLGSLILCAKADVTEFSALPTAAFAEMDEVISELEMALQKTFSYDKINYLMLMMVDPNVHFHVIPRFNNDGHSWNWNAHAYDSPAEMAKVAERIRKGLPLEI